MQTYWVADIEGDPPTPDDIGDIIEYLMDAEWSYWSDEDKAGADRVIDLLVAIWQAEEGMVVS